MTEMTGKGPESVDIDAIDPNEENESLNVEDSNPMTFINENLWKKFAFKLLSYLTYTIFLAIITEPVIGFLWGKFVFGIQFSILPLVWQSLDAQSRNKEIQEKFKADIEKAKVAGELEKAQGELNDAKIQLEIVKAALDDKCASLEANKKALASVK